MTRDLLNSMPDWVLFLVVVGGVVIVSLAGLLTVRHFLPHWRVNAEVSVAVGAMVMTLFALVLAFAAVNLYDSYRAANINVESEANSLAQITRDVRVFNHADQAKVDRAIAVYIREVRDKEFPEMHDGTINPEAVGKFEGVFAAIQSIVPVKSNERAFYDSAVSKLNDAVAERRNRISEANSSLPNAFWSLLLITAFASIAITFFLKVDNPAMEYVLVGAVALVVGAGLMTVLLLEYPFSGSIAVSSEAFTHGALAGLLVQYP